jgi:YD repeat-containing protein
MIAWLAAVLLLAVAYSLGAWPAYAGEEIDPRSGRLRIASVDLVVPAGPVQLVVQRETSGRRDGALGPGWGLDWEARLVRAGDKVEIVDGSGAGVPFALVNGAWRSPAGERLEPGADGSAIRIRPDLTREHYDAGGRLQARELRNGNVVRFNYGSGGQPVEITGPFGAAIALRYDASGRGIRALPARLPGGGELPGLDLCQAGRAGPGRALLAETCRSRAGRERLLRLGREVSCARNGATFRSGSERGGSPPITGRGVALSFGQLEPS